MDLLSVLRQEINQADFETALHKTVTLLRDHVSYYVPIFSNSKVVGEIDIDSDTLDAFTGKDQKFLEKVAVFLGEKYAWS